MLEARLTEAGLLRRIVESLKDLVTDASFEFTDEGMSMQAMDSSHVSLCALKLDRECFDSYRCDKATPLGLSLASLGKILKCARDDDTLTLKAGEQKDILTLMFENKAQDKIMDFNLKLMDIDEEALGIPEQEYSAQVNMDSSEFAKIIRDLAALGDTAKIGCSKEGVSFHVDGEIGAANITIKKKGEKNKEKTKAKSKPAAKKVKTESPKKSVKREVIDDDEEEEEMEMDGDVKSEVKEQDVKDEAEEIVEEEEADDEEVVAVDGKKRKKDSTAASSENKRGTELDVVEPVELTFALRYLRFFTQATPLTGRMNFAMAQDVPLMVEYPMEREHKRIGAMQFYLAPKIDEDAVTQG